MLTTSWEFYVFGTCRWRDQKANNLMKRDTIINVSLKQIFLCIVWLFLIVTLIPICHLRISNLKIRILLHACHNLCFISVLRIGWCINFCGRYLGVAREQDRLPQWGPMCEKYSVQSGIFAVQAWKLLSVSRFHFELKPFYSGAPPFDFELKVLLRITTFLIRASTA